MGNPGGLIVAGFVLLVLITLSVCAYVGARDVRKREEYYRMMEEDFNRENQDPYL